VAYRAGRYALKGAAYRASRTPTLNELHRGFRAGNVVTNPNPLLEPETLTGFEFGVLGSYGDVSVRGTVFFSNLDKRHRQHHADIDGRTNHAATAELGPDSRSGAEFEVDARLNKSLSVTGQLVFTSSHFRGSKERRPSKARMFRKCRLSRVASA
jgi:outer membrane receptor protein involved in Fe transport